MANLYGLAMTVEGFMTSQAHKLKAQSDRARIKMDKATLRVRRLEMQRAICSLERAQLLVNDGCRADISRVLDNARDVLELLVGQENLS